MMYTKFRIQNFKGIKDTTIDLHSEAGAAIFPFVGLNESGKTTILEAIHTFSPDYRTDELLGGRGLEGTPVTERVPRQMISTFTGEIVVSAQINMSLAEKTMIIENLLADEQLKVDGDRFPLNPTISRKNIFSNGEYTHDIRMIEDKIFVKTDKEKSGERPPRKSLRLYSTKFG